MLNTTQTRLSQLIFKIPQLNEFSLRTARFTMAIMSESANILNLWKRKLGRVPDSVWEQIHLEALILADNDLTEVSEQLGRLNRLRMLDLGHNQLTQLPDSSATSQN